MAVLDALSPRAFASTNETVVPAVRRYAVPISLTLILLLAGLLRFTGRNWDDSQNLHPDERFLTMVATTISWPDSIGGYFDSQTSTLNPYNYENFPTFIYGTFPLFLGKAWGEITGNSVYGNYHLASRSMSAMVELLAILLVFLIGRRLFGDTVALLAALLHALSALSIQLSHFGTFDNFVTMFCLATFCFALRANDQGKWWEFALAGAMGGLAVASKLSALPILAVVALPLVEQIRINGFDAYWRRPSLRGIPALLGVLLALICAMWVFRITQPYAFASGNPLDFRLDVRWTNDVDYWRAVQSGEADAPPSVQWANRTPLVFLVKNLVLWGMGPALGIASLAGLALAGVRILTSKRMPPAWLLVLVGWPAFHLVYYGFAFTRTMRYIIPAYPFLILLAAAFLVAIAVWTRRRLPHYPWLGYAPLAGVVLFTALYALAFSSIYTRPVTRVAASEWIYQNLPAGSIVLTEHWDDGLPLALPGYPSPSEYPSLQMTLYDLDSAEKLSSMMDKLEDGDYLFLTSNRLYESIPRIPERYPMTIEYYRMLFAGELGFELMETFTSYPEIFGIEINDDNAEEAFTVYDHPKVYLFQKTEEFDADQIATHLARFLSEDIVNVKSADAGYNMLLMDDAERITQQSGGAWSRIFDADNLANRFPAVTWYLALQLLALAALPLCWRILHRLPDHGYAVSKTVGLLGAGFVAWILASLHIMSFGRLAVVFGVLAVAAISVIVSGGNWRRLFADLRSSWRTVLVAEVLFLGAFVFFVWLRSQNPDLWHPARGGEKPMEFAYFNAVIKSTHFPPYDPWFAGGYINYYYFGYVLLASLTRLTGIVPEVSFNLAVATCFALTVINAWSFVASALRLLTREIRLRSPWAPLALGLTGPLLVAIVGNLDMARRIGAGEWGYSPVDRSRLLSLGTLGDIARGLFRAITDPRTLPTDAFWTPSRIIDGTINEFPYFSFLFADLHPHMIAIPFSTAALLVGLGILTSSMWPKQNPSRPESAFPVFGIASGWRTWLRELPRRPGLERAALIGLAALVTGVMYPLNTWDYPTYLLIVGGAFFLLDCLGSALASARTKDLDWRISFAVVRRATVTTATVLILGRLLFFPYFSNYQVQNSGFEPWLEQSGAGQYLVIHGLLLFLIGSFVLTDLLVGAGRNTYHVSYPKRLIFDRGADPDGHALSAHVELGQATLRWSPQSVFAVVLLVLAGFAVWLDSITGLLLSLILMIGLEAWHRQ
ncbi:hypothetical protein BH23CHL4_BH23CHL4_06610 [soil metagenome]